MCPKSVYYLLKQTLLVGARAEAHYGGTGQHNGHHVFITADTPSPPAWGILQKTRECD